MNSCLSPQSYANASHQRMLAPSAERRGERKGEERRGEERRRGRDEEEEEKRRGKERKRG